MLKIKIIILSLVLLIINNNCQNKEYNNSNMMNNSTITNDIRIIDDISLDNSIIPKENINLKKYKYKGIYIEDLYIRDLLKREYRADFINYLNEINNEDDVFKSTLISQLLFIRWVQLSDTNSFYILSEISKDASVSYNGIELFPHIIVKYFIENPYAFIQQGSKYNDTTLLQIVNINLDEFLITQNFYEEKFITIKLKEGQLLIPNEKLFIFNDAFQNKISKYEKEIGYFLNNHNTKWENKPIEFIDISPIFKKELLQTLNIAEKNYYNLKISPILNKYIIKKNISFSYNIISDPDGYTNLRKDKSINSEVLQKIKSGEHIQVLDNMGDWFLIKTKEVKKGYVHRSRIISN